MARRLVEAGTSFLLVSGAWGYFDHHGDEVRWGGIVKGLKPLLPRVDRTLNAIVTDLEQRGLLESTLILMMGEFGRSPVMTKTAGRGHWTKVMAGGGLRHGQVIGSSVRKGHDIATRLVRPADLAATVFTHLGIDSSERWVNPQGLSLPIVAQGGRAIPSCFNFSPPGWQCTLRSSMRVLRLLLLLVVLCPAFARADQKPNFVFFLVDDLGWTDLKTFGSPFYDTPNCDRIAATGMKFTNAYAACPVCSPTRASIMTGRYPTRTGVTDYIGAPAGKAWRRNTRLLPAIYTRQLELKEFTIAEALKQKGYATFFAGKWHLGNEGFWPEDQGFDVNMGGHHRGGPYGGKKYFSPYGNPRLTDGPDGEHLPDRLATETVKFMTANKDKSFLAYLSFYSVHTPLIARKDLTLKYQARKKERGLQAKWGQEHNRKVRLVQEHAVYGGMVEAMDTAVGKVLDGLKKLKLEENTVVFFMSDNGGLSTSEGHPTSNLPLRGGKGWMYEGGIREPMMVRWPGVTQPGSVNDTPVTSTDFFPTILDMASVELELPLPIDGVSFTSALRGKRHDRGAMYWHYPHYGNQGCAPTAAVREGDWKLIEWYENGKLELFNLKEDIAEKNDLAKKHPDKVKILAAKLANWRKDTGAVMPALNKKFDPKKREGR